MTGNVPYRNLGLRPWRLSSVLIEEPSSLNLHKCKIGRYANSASQVSDILSETDYIKSLNLSSNQLDETDASEFAGFFRQDDFLDRLNISDNPLGCDGVIALCAGLFGHQSIEHLNFNATCLYDKGLSALLKTASSLPYLTHLYLKDNQFTDKGVRKIIDFVDQNPHIVEIDISNNWQISDRINKRLKDKLVINALKRKLVDRVRAGDADAVLHMLKQKTFVLDSGRYTVNCLPLTGLTRERENIVDLAKRLGHDKLATALKEHFKWQYIDACEKADARARLHYSSFVSRTLALKQAVYSQKVAAARYLIKRRVDILNGWQSETSALDYAFKTSMPSRQIKQALKIKLESMWTRVIKLNEPRLFDLALKLGASVDTLLTTPKLFALVKQHPKIEEWFDRRVHRTDMIHWQRSLDIKMTSKTPYKDITIWGDEFHERLSRSVKEVKSGRFSWKANHVAASVSFVVSDRPRVKGGEHARKVINVRIVQDTGGMYHVSNFYPITSSPLKLPRSPQLHEDIRASMPSPERDSLDESFGTKDNQYHRRFHHSERALFAFLKQESVINSLLDCVEAELKGQRGLKVYAVVVDFHSTRYMCNDCGKSVFYQYSPMGKFLQPLMAAIKTRGHTLPKSTGVLASLVRVSADKKAKDQTTKRLADHGDRILDLKLLREQFKPVVLSRDDKTTSTRKSPDRIFTNQSQKVRARH